MSSEQVVPVNGPRSVPPPEVASKLTILALQGALIASVVTLSLGFGRNLRIPLRFAVDSLVFLAQSKGTIENGWWWTNGRLGAPLGFQALLFPSNTNVDQAFVWVMGLFTKDAILATTLSWVAMLVVAGWVSTYCLRLLGRSWLVAGVAGVLYALTPYALYRSIDHFNLVTYLVPFPATLSLIIASGRVPRLRSWRMAPLLAGCALLGFNYIYYAFFACFFLLVATAMGYLSAKDARVLKVGGAALAGVMLCVGLNLLPSLLLMRSEGNPVIINPKVPAEAELYGLKIRHLVSPVVEHRFPPFRLWHQKEAAARFPLETENWTTRLGAVGTVGFLALMAFLLLSRVSPGHEPPVLPVARLTAAGLLLATIGGFGSLFNLLINADIRAYNRIVPFLAFFALLAVAVGLDAIIHHRRRLGVAVAWLVLTIGVWDQAQALAPLRHATKDMSAEFVPLSDFVDEVERLLPKGAMVLQLPFTTFLADPGIHRMQQYDHFKPYLVSRSLSWSYPAMSNKQFRWQQVADRLAIPHLAGLARAEGFRAIWVDKFGYGDEASATLSELESVPGIRMVLQNGRYAVLAIDPVASSSPGYDLGVRELLRGGSMAALAGPCGGPPLMAFDEFGSSSPAAPEPILVPWSAKAVFSGWAATPNKTESGVAAELAIGDRVFPAYYGYERPDVAAHLNSPASHWSGFRVEVPGKALLAGPQKLRLRLLDRERLCYFESPAIAVDVR